MIQTIPQSHLSGVIPAIPSKSAAHRLYICAALADIPTDIACDVLAQKMSLSLYEFRRIFSFMVGCPISEYIRKRRLSLATWEILTA